MATNGYCSEAQLREHLGDDGGQLPEALLTRAINATSRAVDRFCGRRFWQDSTVQAKVYRIDDPQIAWVDDISTTTGLIVATDTTGDGSYATTWTSDQYQLEPLNADTESTAHAWWRIVAIDTELFPVHELRTTLRVTAKFGWSAIADDIEEASLLKSASLFKRRGAVFGVESFGEFGGVRISAARDPDVAALLHPFVKMRVGSV